MTISDEAVEAAAKYLGERFFWNSPLLNEVAREVLEAAAPYIAAEAWDDGEQAGYVNHAAEPFGGEYTNPYRSQA